MRTDLAIVVVSYNTRELLRACLSALRSSLDRACSEVVVVDNASADGSADMVAAQFPWVRLLALTENRGFAAANNLAWREVDARYGLLLNSDTEVLGDAPSALVRFMDEHPRVGAAGGRLLNPDLTFQHSCFRFPTLPMSLLDFFPLNHRIAGSRLNGRYPRSWYARAFRVDHPLGACLIVRREVIERVGGLDEGFFMYCEEVDWCYRIQEAGWDIAYTPDAEVIHHVAASSRQQAGPMLIQLHRSRDRLFRQHYGAGFAWAARQIVRLGMLSLARRSRREAAMGRIDRAELDGRLAIYREVVRW